MPLITARRSAELHRMFGVNVHLGDGEYPAIAKYAEIINDLGIKLYRCGKPPGTIRSIEYLYANTGAKICFLTSPYESGSTPDTIVATINQIGKEKIAYIENYNEPDGFGKPSYKGIPYPGSVRAFAQDLYNKLKAPSANMADIKIVGTSPAYYNTGELVSIAEFVDYGNSHPYPADQMPEETNQYGSWVQAYYDGSMRMHGNKPVIVTEDGYYKSVNTTETDPGNRYPISEKAFAKYIARRALFLFENNIADVFAWFLYELRDGHTANTADKESQFGLCNSDGIRKPAFTVLKNLIATVKDGGVNELTFTPTALDITFGGDTSNLESRLLQKSNGKYVLALWRGLRSYKHTLPRTDIDYTATNVIIGLLQFPSFVIRTDLLTGTKTTLANGQSISVPVADSVVLIELDMSVTTAATPIPFVTLYDSPSLQGAKLEINQIGLFSLSGTLAYFDNRTESLKVAPGKKVTLYSKLNMSDPSTVIKVFTEGSHNTLSADINNFTSNVRIESV